MLGVLEVLHISLLLMDRLNKFKSAIFTYACDFHAFEISPFLDLNQILLLILLAFLVIKRSYGIARLQEIGVEIA